MEPENCVGLSTENRLAGVGPFPAFHLESVHKHLVLHDVNLDDSHIRHCAAPPAASQLGTLWGAPATGKLAETRGPSRGE